MREPVEAYFTQLRDIRASGAGVAETSYYGPLANLLGDVGKHLKPKVRAIINLRNTGGGIPDGGLFTAPQLKGWEPGENPLPGQLPNRGAIEVKGASDDAFAVAESEQVARYVERYGLVLVTNLRDFVLVGRDVTGSGVRTLETCSLATSEAAFWARVAQPHVFADSAAEGLTEFLRRVLLHNAPLSDPKDLAWFLASYARTARLRLEHRHELPALDQLRSQLEDALGLKFEGDKGDHFFRSTLVQTLFYGMFASWVLWARDKDHTQPIAWESRFQWETATATLHVPMVYELFRQFADVRQLGALGISEVLEWAEEVIWRIDRAAFFEKFREEHAVQYFYEPFLEAFDPQLRKELGVWYTPDEVVKYMVSRVDTVLREELGIADGLADESVVVLDPCCGTGAYLVEVLRKIDETLTAKGADALTRHDVKHAAMSRVIGFEILPAPYVVAHLQMGILLAELGVPLRDADERAAIYLTNALTGWGDGTIVAPPKHPKVGPGQTHSTLLFPEFAEERDAANRVKREAQILVVIGNPPYNGYAGVAVDEERSLSDAYRTANLAPKPQGQGLNDLYVRFFRMAERQIVERAGRGVVCFISNNSWLDSQSFTGMRERFLGVFNSIRIDNLNGDKYRTGKVTPDGRPDPSVFSTAKNREGIQVGTAVACLVLAAETGALGTLRYRDLWGVDKLRQLDEDARRPAESLDYATLEARTEVGLPYVAGEFDEAYFGWPVLTDLFSRSFPGVKTSRDSFLVDTDRASLAKRVRDYFDPSRGDDELSPLYPELFKQSGRFAPSEVRRFLVTRGDGAGRIAEYSYRPMDNRWVYWDPDTKLLDEKRPDYIASWPEDGIALVTTGRTRKGIIEPPVVARRLVDLNYMDSGARVFPMRLAGDPGQLEGRVDVANISSGAEVYLRQTGGTSADLLYHTLALVSSARYRQSNVGALRHGWPRVPLPMAGLSESARLGKSLADALEAAAPPDWVIGFGFGVLSSVETVLDASTDLGLTAHWGIAGQGGICMPSTGKLTERPYTADERAAITEGAESLGMSAETAIALLGETCFDVYLNDVAYWRCVPANVWRYTIGGYQVIKKWLSYRERALLGRDLKPEEARYVTEMVRRIGALVLMQPELDANYERVKGDVWEWGAQSADHGPRDSQEAK